MLSAVAVMSAVDAAAAVTAAGGGGQRRAAQSVGNYVAETRSVADVCGELRYISQLSYLTCGPERRHPPHGECERKVICEDPELAAFQYEPEVSDRCEHSQQLSIKR